jgi:hypothetical protein
MMSEHIIEALKIAADELHVKRPNLEHMPELLRYAATEIERLRRVIDSRPAINAALPDTYVAWTQGIYAADILNARFYRQ